MQIIVDLLALQRIEQDVSICSACQGTQSLLAKQWLLHSTLNLPKLERRFYWQNCSIKVADHGSRCSAIAVSRLSSVQHSPARSGPWLDRRGPSLALLQMAVRLPGLPQLSQVPLISPCRVRSPQLLPQCLMHVRAKMQWLAQEARMALCWARAGLVRGQAAFGGQVEASHHRLDGSSRCVQCGRPCPGTASRCPGCMEYWSQAHLSYLQMDSLLKRRSEGTCKLSMWQMLAAVALLQQAYDV